VLFNVFSCLFLIYAYCFNCIVLKSLRTW